MYERTYRQHVLKDDGEPRNHKKRFTLKHFLFTLLFAIILTGIVWALRSSVFQIRSVSVEGTNVTDPEDVKVYIERTLLGKKLFIFPRSSTFLISTKWYEKKLQEDFTRFEIVSVTRDTLHSLRVSVKEYDGVYLWCNEFTACFFMDKKGIVFSEAPYFSGSAYPKLFIGTGKELPFQAISEHELQIVETVLMRLRAAQIEISEFHFINNRELNLYFSHQAQQTKIIIDPTSGIDTTIEILIVGMNTAAFKDQFEKTDKILEYIDLRFSNKMVYKFQ